MSGKKVTNVVLESSRGRSSGYGELLELPVVPTGESGEAMSYENGDDGKAYNRINQAVHRMNKKHDPMKWSVGVSKDKSEILVQRVA